MPLNKQLCRVYRLCSNQRLTRLPFNEAYIIFGIESTPRDAKKTDDCGQLGKIFLSCHVALSCVPLCPDYCRIKYILKFTHS
jgi:hypothetical protein